MKRIFLIFIVLVCKSFIMVSCSCFDNPANAERIGDGYIQYNEGIYFVEVDNVKYTSTSVYTDTIGDIKTSIKPIEGMIVTCFRLHGDPEVNFIVGIHSEEYLEEYFTTNSAAACVFGLIFIIGIAVMLMDTNVKKTSVHSD